MGKLLVILTSCFLFTFASANVLPNRPVAVKASEVFIPIGNAGQLISLQELSVVSSRDLQKMTGKRMSIINKISFKAGQKKLRNSIRADGTLDKNFEK